MTTTAVFDLYENLHDHCYTIIVTRSLLQWQQSCHSSEMTSLSIFSCSRISRHWEVFPRSFTAVFSSNNYHDVYSNGLCSTLTNIEVACCRRRNLNSVKAGFHQRRSRSRSQNQKLRAYELLKTAFWFRLRLRRLRPAYDLVKTNCRSRKKKGKDKPNTKRGTSFVIGSSFRFCPRLRQSGFP